MYMYVSVQMLVCVSVCLCVCARAQVLTPSCIQRLHDWRFIEPLHTYFHDLNYFPHPPSTLATILRHMADIQAPSVTLRVLTYTWTAELSQAAAAVLAELPQLRLDLTLHQLTDALLGAVLEVSGATHLNHARMAFHCIACVLASCTCNSCAAQPSAGRAHKVSRSLLVKRLFLRVL